MNHLAFFVGLSLILGPAQRYDHRSDPGHSSQCKMCHKVKNKKTYAMLPAASKPLHANCDECHETEFVKGMRQLSRKGPSGTSFCATCHKKTKNKRVLSLVYPPYLVRGTSSFVLAKFDHGKHATLKNVSCEQCHGQKTKKQTIRPSHAQCISCHEKDAPPKMSQCKECHQLADAPSPSNFQVKDIYRNYKFSHAKHAKKLSKPQPCTTCHANINPNPGEPIQRPKKPDCMTCHDGQQAFSVLGTQCGLCHTKS